MILLTLSRGKGKETVRLQLPASPAEIGEAFVALDGISLDTTTTTLLDVSSNVPGVYRRLYDVNVEDSEQFQKLQKLAEYTEALSPAKATIFSGALEAERAEGLDKLLAVANRLDEYMMAWSAEPKKGYLTREGIAVMRSRMTNAIFHEEMKELYIKKDAAYKESIQTAKESLLLYIRMLENSESADPVIEQKLCDLPHALEQVDGKHVYGYLPKEIKAQVDEIVEQLAQLPEVAACYEQWWKLKDEIASYYGRNTPSHQPLVQQKEFRAIKNFIIREAKTICEPTPVQTSTDAEKNEQQNPLDETPTAVQQPQIAPLQNALTADAVMQLLHHMSRMFRGNMPVIPPALRIDSKRRRRLQEKRMAMGRKWDDHEDEQLHHVNDNTMR